MRANHLTLSKFHKFWGLYILCIFHHKKIRYLQTPALLQVMDISRNFIFISLNQSVCFHSTAACYFFHYMVVVSFLLELSLVVICSSENEDRAHMAAALDQYRLGIVPHCASPREIREYLKKQFNACSQQQRKFRDRILSWTPAAVLDKEK